MRDAVGAPVPEVLTKCASLNQLTREMRSSASCAISGWQEGCVCIPPPTRRTKRSLIRASMPLPDYDTKPVMAFSAT